MDVLEPELADALLSVGLSAEQLAQSVIDEDEAAAVLRFVETERDGVNRRCETRFLFLHQQVGTLAFSHVHRDAQQPFAPAR